MTDDIDTRDAEPIALVEIGDLVMCEGTVYEIDRELLEGDESVIYLRPTVWDADRQMWAAAPHVTAAQPAPDALRDHVFRAADGEAKCPTCGFPAWAHDPATAVMRTWTIQPAHVCENCGNDGCECRSCGGRMYQPAPDALRAAAQNLTDRRTLMDDGFWVSQKEMRALDEALGRTYEYAAGVTVAPQPADEPSCCELACYEDPGCACEGCTNPAEHLGPDDHGHTGRLWCDPCVGHGVMLEQGMHRCKPAPALDVERLREAAQAYLDAFDLPLTTDPEVHYDTLTAARDRLRAALATEEKL